MAVNSNGAAVFQWQHNGQWCVGVQACDVNGYVIIKYSPPDNLVLMKSFYELYWVKVDDLQPYPATPIPEPEVRHAGT
jgi:hypothetical protein